MKLSSLFASFLIIASQTTSAFAMSMDEFAKVSILPGWRMDSGHHMAAVRVTLAPGWKTYWRVPGEAGIPPSFDLSGSGNLKAMRVHWPIPKVFDQNGYRSVGYEGELILPVEFAPRADGVISLHGTITIGVCEEVCVPLSVPIDVDLADGGSPSDEITASLANKPKISNGKVQCTVEPIDDGLTISLSVKSAPVGHLVVETDDPTIWVSSPVISNANGVLQAVADLVPIDAKPFALDRSTVRITTFTGLNAVEYRGCVGAG